MDCTVKGAPIPLFDVVPRLQIVDLALFVAIDDGCERIGQIGMRIPCGSWTP
jgi:hypothetical protein